MDAHKALVWRGNNFGVVTTPTYTYPLQFLVTYFLPVYTPRMRSPDVFATPTARLYGITPKYMLWIGALPCIVYRHWLPIHRLVSLCVLPVQWWLI
jgi:hypothetical protein